jgi:uncharacterized membrane protein YgcG
MRIVKLVSTNAEIVMHILDSVLVNGETNSSHFRNRMMAHFESKKTLWTAAPAFKDFLITAVFLGNHTSSAEPQKSTDKQSVRLDDFVSHFNPQNASDIAVAWEAIETFRNGITNIDTEFGLALSVAIRAWITMLRSGISPSNIMIDYLLIINRRKFAALGLLLQDSASESVSDEDAVAALDVWSSWDKIELEQECTDFIRNKRSRDKDESIAKKQKLDASAKNAGRGGGGGQSGSGGGGAGRWGAGGGRGRGTGLLSGRGFPTSTHLPSTQVQASVQGQSKGFCLDFVGGLMSMPNAGCSRQPCKFDHSTTLKDIDRISLESDARGILKSNAPRLAAFLAAMGIVKFKGE